MHPVDCLLPYLSKSQWVAAHLNYVEDRHLELLSPARGVQVTVVYCPRASAYFGHPMGGRSSHRYREMMQCGINVALGTDSIICLNTPDRISVLDDMRFLYQRDATDPRTLLRMATINGANALGVDPALFTLSPGPTAGLLAIELPHATIGDPLHDALRTSNPPRWVHKKPDESQ
jgi:5-methylthioadenosine/S-adenosylhomocysteine deaminase